MNCKEFESIIHEIVSRRMADKTKQLEALKHAGHCLWCALRLDEETKLTESLQGLSGALQGQRAPVRVEEALLQAFRERTLRAPAPRFGLAGKRLWGGLRWGLVFAATVAIACIVILQWPHLRPRSSAPVAQGANNQPLASSEASQAKPHGRPESGALDDSAGELTTDFIPLGTCDDSQCMDEATLVRVTLPADAPLAFGLALDNDYGPEGSVQADVALANDGVPFAIRFVD